MKTGTGTLVEIFLDGSASGRISCPPGLGPSAGQYVLALDPSDSISALPVPVFSAGYAPGGFLAAPRLPRHWTPGMQLNLRGPLGKGFNPPSSARFITLIACGKTPARLLALTPTLLAQGAAIVLLCDSPPNALPTEIEVMPLSSLPEVLSWTDYIALDMPRSRLDTLPGLFVKSPPPGSQILISTRMPCGALADCGVCAVATKKGPQLVCKDGPVFDLGLFIPKF